jgi:hypothetical protein
VRDRPVDDEIGELVLFDAPDRQSARYAGKVSDQRLLENLRSFVAPIAKDASAVVEDPRALQMARDLSEVFAEHARISGLTKAEAEQALARQGPLDRTLFESRFDLFVRMGLIQPSPESSFPRCRKCSRRSSIIAARRWRPSTATRSRADA